MDNIQSNNLTESKKFVCEICTYKTNSKSNFKTHNNKHTKENTYECNFCDFVTIYKDSFSKHMKNIHTADSDKDKKFKCEFCEYRTTSKGYLLRHLNIHTKEKTYKCNICGFVTPHKGNLNIHLTNIHTDPEQDKKFKCEICQFKTTSKGYLVRHLNIHTKETEFKCDLCTFSTYNHSSFKSHKKNSHIRAVMDKKFICEICSYQTDLEWKINQHLNTHSEQINNVELEDNLKQNVSETNIKGEEEIIEVGPVELQFAIKEESFEVIQKSMPVE